MTPDSSRVLAIDVGSSAVRAAIVDAETGCLDAYRIERSDAHSGLRFDAESLWADTVAAIEGLDSGLRRTVGALGIAAHIGTVYTDAAFRPLGPGHGWADSSGAALLPPSAVGASGRPAPGGGALAALLDLRASFGTDAVRHVLSPKDFLIARLTGDAITDHTSAAYTFASDVRSRAWNTALLEELHIDPTLFPRQFGSTAIAATVVPSVSVLLGLPPQLPVVGGGPDGTVGATFALGLRTDALADVAGTTDVLVRLTPSPADAPPSSVLNPNTLPGTWTAGGSTGMTGGAVAHWTSILGLGDPAHAAQALSASLASIPAGAEGLLVRPLLSGSRFPRWDASERGALAGLASHHTSAHILRAVQEGAAFAVREGVDVLLGASTQNVAESCVVLAGGAARSPALAQLRADVFGRPVEVCSEPDVSLLGAALLALLGISPERAVREITGSLGGTRTRREPNRTAAALYDGLYGEWQAAGASTALSGRETR